MKKVLLSIIAVAILFVGAQAQITFAPRVGLNMANVGGDDTDDNKMKMGMQIGAIVNYGFSDALSLQTGLLFSQKGTKIDAKVYSDPIKITVNYLEIPINAVYGLELGGNTLQFLAGPYIGIGLSGKMKSNMDGFEDVDIQFVNNAIDADADKAPMKRFDFGLNIGAGYKINNIQIQANYGLGFANLISDYDGLDDKNTNGVMQVSVAYFFGE